LSSSFVGVSFAAVKEKSNIWLAIVLMVAFAMTRWPGLLPENFSAAYALAFCAGVYFPTLVAWWLPLATLAATDMLMNVFYYEVTPLNAYMLVNYVAYAGIIGIGRRFSARAPWLSLVAGGLLGAVLFYLVTNTAAWLQNPEYAKTFAGWVQALTTGIPRHPPTWMFFWKTLLSSGLFTGLFVGAMKFSEKMASAVEKEPGKEASAEETEETQAEESKA
jgi:hypothetical protein